MAGPTRGIARNVRAAFAAAVAADPTRPLLTFYDDAAGARVEFSADTVDNWVSKTANLLVDGCGLGVGDRAVVLLSPHWQTAAVLLGCWSAGLVESSDPGTPADVLFATAQAASETPPAADSFALGLTPMGAPLRELPPGFADYVTEARAHGDHFQAAPLPDSAIAVDGSSHEELCERARQRAAALGVGAGDRVLVDAKVFPDPVDWLLAPLLAGASIVLCDNLSAGAVPARVASERVTVVLGG